MFSGLTNQVSSWMAGSKGAQEEGQAAPAPVEEERPAGDDKKDPGHPKHSKLEMLTNVKNQFGGWLGSGIPLLRKGDEQGQGGEGTTEAGVVPGEGEEASSPGPTGNSKEDDDNSSATGGADSGPGSGTGTPTDDAEGQFGTATDKAIAGAKSIGSFLYSAVNKAGKTVSEASAKIKKTVEENSILGEFNREQNAFLKERSERVGDSALPPWVGLSNEEALREECLQLSTEKRNFVRSPPAGVEFHFDYDVSYPVASAIMAIDPNLEKMRFELVPKVISEENFWRNYFYRVSLICQAGELSSMATEGNTDQTSEDRPTADKTVEFVSDNFQTDSKDIIEVEEGMKRLTDSLKKPSEDEWEKELESELQDYEVVSQNSKLTTTKDFDDILDEETDLK